jgi:hypothetical protein
MSNSWLGVVVSGNGVTGVHLDCEKSPPELTNQFTWSLQAGDRPEAFVVMYERIRDYVREQEIQNVAVKASALGQARATSKHLESAELRGVVIAAAKTGGAKVHLIKKAVVSRNFGERKADEYISDNTFWASAVNGDVLKTRREAALLVLSMQVQK